MTCKILTLKRSREIFGRVLHHDQKNLRKFVRKFFLEPFKVKNLIVIVTWIFFYPNIVRFWCLVAQKKAKVEFYETDKTEKKWRRLGT